jgi:uncharacterized protein YndB with AHSA1/START domain
MPRGPATGSTADAWTAGGGRLRTLSWSRHVATPPDETWACLLAELWVAGAGFGPRPVIEEAGDADGTGCTRRIGVGARGVRERITATEVPHRLEYRVVNPSWTTFPVDHHRGTVTFAAAAGGGTEVRWRVELVPKRGAGPLVVAATRFVIGRYLDALTRACRSALNRSHNRRNRRS